MQDSIRNLQQRQRIDRRQFLGLATGIAASYISLPIFAQAKSSTPLNVYKSETCGCCVNWIDHMQQHGYASTVHHPQDLNGLKEELGVLPEWQSCHTAVTEAGFVFEGHVPARYISQFLAAPPANAIGLAVPGMPMGSPGMEMGNRFMPYDVVLMRKNGTSEVYVAIKNVAEQ